MRYAVLALLAASGFWTALSHAPEASACGGFFCSQVPVDQMGEQIIFGINDDSIVAHIQIAYTGEADDFAWVLPVATKPELSLGNQTIFSTVVNATNPQFNLTWDWENSNCLEQGQVFADAAGPPTDTDADGLENGGGGGVTVLEQGEVGPFETVILESSDASALVNWLNANNFDQPDEAAPLIAHYVDQGMLFVGLRLKKSAEVGEIQPIVLEFEEADPCVPLVLTQIAAVPDMPVRIWVLGEHRVIPTNWLHVVLNEKKIDWVNRGVNYNDVVTQAVDEAAGHGFVTEFAGSSERFRDRFWTEDRYDLTPFAEMTEPGQLVQELLWAGFPRDATMQAILRKYIPMPQTLIDQGIDDRSFYNNIQAYADDMPDDYVLDTAGMLAEIEEKIVAPLRIAQEMFDSHPYATRLYTTVSPEDMTRDPIFAQNPDLGDIDNVHQAEALPFCDSPSSGSITSAEITLSTGEVYTITGDFQSWGGSVDEPAVEEPSAKRIELVGRQGQPKIVAAGNVTTVDQDLDSRTPEQVFNELEGAAIVSPPSTIDPGNNTGDANDDGCSGSPSGPAAWLLIALALAAVTGRSRQRVVVRRRR